MPPPQKRDSHPIRLVRTAYLRSGFRHLHTAAGFAHMLGYSDSLIRNTESGILPLSEKLALRIERATGVSQDWLQDAARRWQQGDDLTNAQILNAQGEVWRPSCDKNTGFTDDFVDVVEIFYQHFPAALPAFIGAAMEAFLAVESPHHDGLDSPSQSRKKMRRYIDSLILPLIRLIDNLDQESRNAFFDHLSQHLGGQHAVESGNLLKLWEVMHFKDQEGTHLVRSPRVRASSPSQSPVAAEPLTAQNPRSTQRGKSKN